MAIYEEVHYSKCWFCGFYHVIDHLFNHIKSTLSDFNTTILETRISIMGLRNSGKSTIINDIEKFDIGYKGDDSNNNSDDDNWIQSMPTLKTVISNVKVYKKVIIEYPKHNLDFHIKKTKKKRMNERKTLQGLRSLRNNSDSNINGPLPSTEIEDTDETPLLNLGNNMNYNDIIINFRITDLSGQYRLRYQWTPYFSRKMSDCIMFAIDLSDTLTLEAARQTLLALFKHNQGEERLPMLVVAIHSPSNWNQFLFWQWLAIPKEQHLDFDREIVFYNREKEKIVFMMKWICGFDI